MSRDDHGSGQDRQEEQWYRCKNRFCGAWVEEEDWYCEECQGTGDGHGYDWEEQYRPGFSRHLSRKVRGMLREIQDAGGRSFWCYFARYGECRNALRCGLAHLSTSEITALQREHPGVCGDGSGRPRVQCDNAWFEGSRYHKDLREHP